MADAGKVTVPDFDLELNALGETIIKLGQAAPVTPLLNDVAVDQVAKSLQSAAKVLKVYLYQQVLQICRISQKNFLAKSI